MNLLKIIKTLKFFLISAIFLFAFFSFAPSKTYAVDCSTSGCTCGYLTCPIYVTFTNNVGQGFQVGYQVTVGSTTYPGSITVPSGSGTKRSALITNLQQGDTIYGVKVKWWTSCADPYYTIQNAATVYGAPVYSFYFSANDSSHPMCDTTPSGCSTSGYLNANYAACKYIPLNGSTVYLNQFCPQTVTNRYCAINGWIYGGSGAGVANNCAVLCNTGYQCDGVCHEEKQINTCSGSTSGAYCVNSNATRYNGACTSGCCPYSSVPADAGGLSATSSCTDGSPNQANMTFKWNAASNATSYTLHYYTGGAWHTATTTGTSLTEVVDDNYNVSWYVVTSNCYGSNTGPTQNTTSVLCAAPVLHALANPAVGSATGPTAAQVQSVNHTIGNCNTFAGNLIFGLPATCTGSALGSTDTYIRPYSVTPSSCTFTGFTCAVNSGNGILNCANPSYVNINLQVNDDATLTANYSCSYNITANVYLDNNGNGVRDAGEPLYGSPTTITYSGTLSGSKSITGTGVIPSVPPGNETVTLSVPSGFTATTPSTRTVTGGPDQTINFGIQPPTPTCTGITAQSPIYQRATSQLTSSGCQSYSGQTIDYTWSIPVVAGRGDSISGSSYTAATYTAGPDARQNGYETLPNLQVCNPGLTAGEKTTLCNNYATKIDVLPLYTISGYVYVDTNKDRIKQAGESNTAATVTVTAKNSSGAVVGTASVPTGAGAYTIAGAGGIPSLPAGQYTVSITAPAGYIPTTATSLTVNVGTSAGVGPGGLALTACSPLGAGSLPDPAACDAKGDITNLNFGISNSIQWIQTGPENPAGPTSGGSGDTNMPNGWNNFIPAGTCGPIPHYVSLNGPTVGGGATPGVISVGSGSFNFCPGGAPTAGGCQNSASSTQWVAGGLPSDYPSSFSSVNPGIVRTSYNYLLSIVKQAGITPTPVTAAMFNSSLSHGVYQIAGDLTLGNATGGTYTFPTGDFVVLVNGNLYLKENIKVAHGSTVLFSVSGSIYVDPSVGESSYTSYATDIEGFYSADKDFVIQGGNGNNCPTGDKRINIGGSVVVNASLNGGTLSNQRDLCGNDLSCPTIYVAGRPDFLLNAPLFFMNTRRIWQEVAPNQ